MTPQFGDIVVITARQDDVRWVLAPSGSPSNDHVPNIRLLRPRGDGANHSHTLKIVEVTVIDRPVFEIGERVVGSVAGQIGTIIELGTDDAVGAAYARVHWDRQRVPLRGGGFLAGSEGESDEPLWALVLNNRIEGIHNGNPFS